MVVYGGLLPMENMVVMSVRLPKPLVTWLRKRAAVETIEQDKRVSMNSLLIEIITQAMQSDRRMVTRFAGSGNRVEVDK